MYPCPAPRMREPLGAILGLADRLGPLCPLSITSESSHAACLRCCAVAWSSGSQGGPTPGSRPTKGEEAEDATHCHALLQPLAPHEADPDRAALSHQTRTAQTDHPLAAEGGSDAEAERALQGEDHRTSHAPRPGAPAHGSGARPPM